MLSRPTVFEYFMAGGCTFSFIDLENPSCSYIFEFYSIHSSYMGLRKNGIYTLIFLKEDNVQVAK